MQAKSLVLRCYAVEEGGIWSAMCIDLCLAAQGDTYEEARRKLHAQIGEYVYDALCGDDREFADQLLTRKSPLSMRLYYYVVRFAGGLLAWRHKVARLFSETLPMQPVPNRC